MEAIMKHGMETQQFEFQIQIVENYEIDSLHKN